MKKFKNEVVNGYNGQPLIWNVTNPDGIVKLTELKVINILYMVLNGYNMQSQKDCIEGVKLAKVLDSVMAEDKSIIELEETNHFWLVAVAEKVTPSVFKINGNIVYTLIKDGWVKEEVNNKKGR